MQNRVERVLWCWTVYVIQVGDGDFGLGHNESEMYRASGGKCVVGSFRAWSGDLRLDIHLQGSE